MSQALTPNEMRYCGDIRQKELNLREALSISSLDGDFDAEQWLKHLTEIKHCLGNLSNDLSFLASLLIKNYLYQRFGVINFDAAGKAQGAAGIDIEAQTLDGRKIAGELKTTRPYQGKDGFGAAQRSTMLKDLDRLAASDADYRFMFVIDDLAFKALCAKSYSSRAPGVELVDVVSGHHCVLGIR